MNGYVPACAASACGGTILDVKVAEVLRPVCNDHRRKCDHYIHGAACYYWGKHEDIERHVHRCHTFSGIFDRNRDGGLEYKTEDDDRDFMDVSGMRCFFCKDVPHQPLKLKCNGRAKCAHLICGTSGFRSNCIDKFLRKGAVVKWDMTNESLLLSRCPSRDGGVTLIEMQSPEVTEYYNGKQRKCDWKGENGIADFSDLPAGINKLGVFDVSSPISSMSTGHQHMTVSKKLQVRITMIAGNSKCAAKSLKKALKPIDDSVRKDFEDLTVCCVLQSKAGEAGQGKCKSTSNAVIEKQQPEDND